MRINTLLIANRGEIAIRIINTAKNMGIKTIAIFSVVDNNSQHVMLADHAFCVGEANSQDSYLNRKKIIAIAKAEKVDAIHPGYGFLSEDSEFAQQCQQNNICFIGPRAATLLAMANKCEAKKLMQQAGVPIVPGYQGNEQSLSVLQQQADNIGYPLLIKANGGGGGKGIRQVNHSDQFKQALQAAQHEAQASFDDHTVLLEKYLHPARHIEIQVAADQFGNVVHLFSRDCSIQRRHQKIIEEAPASNIPAELLKKIAETAVKAAKSINYLGVGTFEFLVDQHNNFYFMEMNTRLQVEHPVTEMITGIDLVQWQINIANQERIPLLQQDIHQHGHAIEARIYAENPQKNFTPTTGKITLLHFPATSKNTRIDSAVTEGDDISPYYDPLIAKLIVWGETRQQSVETMMQQLKHTYLLGVSNNIELLSAIVNTPAFINNSNINTEFMPQHQHLLSKTAALNHNVLMFAAISELQWRSQQAATLSQQTQDTHSPWLQRDAWRLRQAPQILRFWYKNKDYSIEATTINDIDINWKKGKLLQARINGNLQQAGVIHQDKHIDIVYQGASYRLHFQPKPNKHSDAPQQNKNVTAPMPSAIVAICVSPGAKVKTNEPLLVLEAMKMQHTIKAPYPATITNIYVNTGDLVQEGKTLITLEQ